MGPVAVLFVSISQVIGFEDRLRNNLDCVGWGVKALLQLHLVFPERRILAFVCIINLVCLLNLSRARMHLIERSLK